MEKNLYQLGKEKIILPMYHEEDVIDPNLARVLNSLLRVKRGITTQMDIMFLTIKEGMQRTKENRNKEEAKGASNLGQESTNGERSESNYTVLVDLLKSLNENEERNYSVLHSMLKKLDENIGMKTLSIVDNVMKCSILHRV